MLKVTVQLHSKKQNTEQIITLRKNLGELIHTTKTIKNKWEKLEHKGEAFFDILFMIRSHLESIKKILGGL